MKALLVIGASVLVLSVYAYRAMSIYKAAVIYTM